jgi:hypothetical protein
VALHGLAREAAKATATATAKWRQMGQRSVHEALGIYTVHARRVHRRWGSVFWRDPRPPSRHWAAERRHHGGVVDVRGRSDLSRFDPRPERPHFTNFGPLRGAKTWGGGGEVRLRCAEPTYFSRVDAKRLQVTDFSRFGAHLQPLHFSRFDPKVPHFCRYSPPRGRHPSPRPAGCRPRTRTAERLLAGPTCSRLPNVLRIFYLIYRAARECSESPPT